ncbi:hydrolase [Agreia sp. Leaf244]|uniref:alpha/beta fold hydrolase n=1 Tax=Agreia sp. Leaf244 TaxID=1736305 RepID=UPI0006F73A92|nr:alpha/beta hydrolase [Agreia sp. Leaf244]KQO07436.1 hydrolase [Agreia sp. Leaf244]
MSRRRRSEPQTNSSTEVTVDRVYDGELYVRVSTIGKTGDRPFVLVPGIGVSSNYFERLAPNLNRFGPVHALDLPGFAGVPHPKSALSIRGYADLVGRVIDELDLVDPIVVGHSMGTQIVTDLASRRPDITTLVLIGPVVNPAERRIPTQALRFLQSAWHEPGRVKFLAVSSYLLCGFKWFFRVLPRMMRFPIEDRLPLVQANTLVIRGEHDAVAPRDWVTRVGELLPHSRSWEMPDSAHSVMHAHADEVARLCVAFAEHPGTDDDTLRTYDLSADDIPDDEDEKPPADAAKAVVGRVTETVGILAHDDETIARGKTMHAESMGDPDEK